MIETLCNLSGCIVDYSRADPAEIYYIWALSFEIIIGTAIAGFVTLKLLLKYRKEFRYD